MNTKHLIYFFLLFAIIVIQDCNGTPTDDKGFIIDIAKKQIEKLISLVEGLVNTAIKELGEMTSAAAGITYTAIKAATNSINMVIDYGVGSIRSIAQNAIDSGINVTECTVINIDNLNLVRRRLIGEEVVCATNKLAEFNTIVNNTIKTFNEDLEMIAELPKRLIECMTSLHMIKCVTALISDVTQLQIDIPKQIMDTMKDIGETSVTFQKDVHQCQFKELREAVDESRRIVDTMTQCVQEANQTHYRKNFEYIF